MPILDLDEIVQEERVIKLQGKEIKVTTVPSKITLKADKIYDQLDEEDPESFEKLVNLAYEMIDAQNDDKEITKDWIIENTSFTQLVRLLEFTLAPLNEMIDSKNPMSPPKTKK